MKLEYVGHKPVISCRGVDFSVGKEDKYVYIEPAAQILHFLEDLDKGTSSTINPNKVLDSDEVFDILYRHKPDFDSYYEKKILEYKKKIEDEMSDVDKQRTLSDIEKDVLKNNLKFMEEYRLQRVTNKLVYEELINSCVDLIINGGVEEINMPFSLPFVHVAESFETTLSLINHTIVAKVEVMLDKATPYTSLKIKRYD